MIAPNHESQPDPSPPDPSDKILEKLQKCEAGIHQIARRISPTAEADDIFQEACFRCVALAFARDWEGDQHGFIYKVARSVAVDAARRTKIRQAVPIQSIPEFESDKHAPEKIAIKREAAIMLRERLALLPPRQLEVIQLRFFQGFSLDEIAERLRIPKETVKSRQKWGLIALRTDPILRAYFESLL